MTGNKLHKRIAIAVSAAGIIVAGAATVPIVPRDLTWVVSYETYRFDTPSGDMEPGYYAFNEEGTNILYRDENDQHSSQFKSTSTPTATLDLGALTETHIVGTATYSEFYDEGTIIRERIDSNEYRKVSWEKNYPQPRKQVLKSLLEDITQPFAAQAAIAFASTTNSGLQSSVSSYSFAHTAIGSNLVLIVGVGCRDATADASSVTFNSDALTEIRLDVSSGTRRASELWYLKNPDADSSFTVAVTLDATSDDTAAGAITLTGVDQTNPLDANNGANGTSGAPTVAVVTVADNSWVVDTVSRNNATLSAGAGQTQHWTIPNSTFQVYKASTEGPKTPAGSVTMSWSGGSSFDFAISAASFKPVQEVISTPSRHQIIIIN